MSSQMPPGPDAHGDPYGAFAGGGQPSEEQVQQMLAQMRVLPVDQHLAQALQLLLEGAQVKVGRNDGRLLLDTVEVLAAHVRPYVDAQLVGQVDEALGQLRMAQVQAESQLQRAAMEEGHAEANDLPTRPRPPLLPEPAAAAQDGGDDGGDDPDAGSADGGGTPPPPPPPSAGGGQGAAGSRLWVPGR